MKRRRKHYRRRGGIGLSAAVTLCLAGSLLLFARAGGEAYAQKFIDRLAGNSDFILRAVSLELGMTPDTAEVYAPRTAAAARSEDADDPLAESTYIPLEEENDAPVLDAADKAATITVNNETSYEVDVAACLAAETSIRAAGDGPQVLIVPYARQRELYTGRGFPLHADRKRAHDRHALQCGPRGRRAAKGARGERRAGDAHPRYFRLPCLLRSYDRSLAAIEDALAANPTIKIVIDVHRDSILTDDGTAYKTACTIDGEEMAQLMFVVGTDEGGLYHPDWQQNLNYVTGLQYQLNRAYPGLMRPVNLRTQRFNQHASPGSMLIEVGSSGNTMPEALAAIRLFGQTLADDLNGA